MIARLKRAIIQAIWRVTTPALAAMFEENGELARRADEMRSLVKDLQAERDRLSDECDQLAGVALAAADLRDLLVGGALASRPEFVALDSALKKLEKEPGL